MSNAASRNHANGVAAAATAIGVPAAAASSVAAAGNATQQSTPARKKGILPKRAKKQVKKLVLKGSPATQLAAEEIIEDSIHERRSSSLDHILEAEDESEEDEPEGDVTASQQVALDAVYLKKLAQKRKGGGNN